MPGGHDEHRHQVFEHRPAPGEQRGRAAGGREQPAEREPVVLVELAAGDEHVAGEAGLRRQHVIEARVEAVLRGVEADGKEPAGRVVEEAEVDVGEFPRGVCEPSEFVPPLGRVPCRVRHRPVQQAQPPRAGRRVGRMIRVVGPSDFHDERQERFRQAGDLAECRGAVEMGEHLAEPCRPRIRLRRDPLPEMFGRRRQCRPGGEMFEVGEMFGRGADQGLGPPAGFGVVMGGAVAGRGRRGDHQRQGGGRLRDRGGFTQEAVRQAAPAGCPVGMLPVTGCKGVVDLRVDPERVLKTDEHPRGRDGRIHQFLEAPGEHQQAADQIAAIHGGDISRQERCERVDVVPVEKVATMSFEAADRVERPADAVDEPRDGAPSEVAGGQIREQGHRDVRGAGAGGDDRLAVHLHVVWRQPVAAGRHVFLEVTPGAAGGGGQKLPVGHGEWQGWRRQREADPPGEQRCHEPAGQPWNRSHDDTRLAGPDKQRGRQGGCQRADDEPANEAGQILRRRALGIGGCPPFQQMTPGDQHAKERACDGIDRHGRLIGKDGEYEHSLGQRTGE